MATWKRTTVRSTAVVLLILGLIAAVQFLRANWGHGTSSAKAGLWTCSMHPQVRMNHPGKCPICGMDLVPVGSQRPGMTPEASSTDLHVFLDPHARRMAGVETAVVSLRPLHKEIRTVGKIEFDETNVAQITARIAGRIDEVFASFPGTIVKQNDHLVSIYSPDLLSTQNELLNVYRRNQGQAAGFSDALVASARRRLELWGVTGAQIEEVLRTGKAQTHVVVYAPRGGTVVQKNVRAGQYVNVGDQLYTIADLGHVWLIIDIYEADLAWVRFGQTIEVILESRPSERFVGTVGFIEPVLNDQTRTVRVRVVLKNMLGVFKPGMYAQALLRVPLLSDGTPAPTGVEGKYACPMHPYIISDKPGDCSVCGMPLERVPGKLTKVAADKAKVLSIPASAVLSTGKRQLVYVERKPGEYHLVEPTLGPRAGDYYPVIKGLGAGQRVVTRGNFLIDSQFQIAGNPSLLYPEGLSGGASGHAGHATTQTGGGSGSRQAGKHIGH